MIPQVPTRCIGLVDKSALFSRHMKVAKDSPFRQGMGDGDRNATAIRQRSTGKQAR